MATPDYKTTSQRDFCFARLQVNKTTRQRVGRQPVELRRGYVGQRTTDNGLRRAVAGGASQELRNYGTTDRASRLGTQSSVTLYSPLYFLYPSILSILTTHC